MATIYFVDDDSATDLVVQHFRDRGHTAERLPTVEDALKQIGEISKADLLVLDLIIPTAQVAAEARADGFNSTGMQVYREVRRLNAEVPILVFTANQDASIVEIIQADQSARYLSRWSSPNFREFVTIIYGLLGLRPIPEPPRVFIVHGHDDATKLAVKNYLQNVLHLPEPIILHEQPNVGRTVIEKFEEYSAAAELTFVLLTPDDRVADYAAADDEKRRARQNVVFELGFFVGRFGRRSGRVFLLYKGPLEIPSDLFGVVYFDITNGIESVSDQIRKEIEAVQKGI